MRDEPSLAGTIGSSRTLRAEVLHSVRTEMAQTLSHCVFRRTDLGTSGHPGEASLRACAHLMASELGWDADAAEARAGDDPRTLSSPVRHRELREID